MPGGGTVDYVNPIEHHYLTDPAHREEGGTPAIVESIRAGLVFQLKQAVGTDVIRAREERFLRRAVESWRANPSIEILGNLDADRLSIVSFVVRRPGGRYLHHNFVVVAAQRPVRHPVPRRLLVRRPVRAPPARHRPRALAPLRAGDRRRLRGHQARLGPGQLQLLHLRGRVPTTSSRRSHLVATHGWALLPEYRFDPYTGLWRHRDGLVEPPLRLAQLHYDADGPLRWPARHERAAESALAGYLAEAKDLFATLAAPSTGVAPSAGRRPASPPASRRCAGSTSPTSASPDLRPSIYELLRHNRTRDPSTPVASGRIRRRRNVGHGRTPAAC